MEMEENGSQDEAPILLVPSSIGLSLYLYLREKQWHDDEDEQSIDSENLICPPYYLNCVVLHGNLCIQTIKGLFLICFRLAWQIKAKGNE